MPDDTPESQAGGSRARRASRDQGELAARVLAGEEREGVRGLVERVGPRDRDDEGPLRGERDEVRSDAIAVRRALRHRAADDADAVLLRAAERGDRDDPVAVGDEGEGDVDRLVRADAVERRGHAVGSEVPDALLEAVAVG